MSIQCRWDTPEQNLFIVEFSESVDWQEFQSRIREAHRKIAVVPHDVDMVILARVASPPGSAMSQFRTAFNSQPPNLKRVVIVHHEKGTALRFATRLAQVLHQLMPKKSGVLFADSLEAAGKILAPEAAVKIG